MLRDHLDVPVICPTCQNIFRGQGIPPATPLFSTGSFLCMGLFSIFCFFDISERFSEACPQDVI
jgi:hypothetical protein